MVFNSLLSLTLLSVSTRVPARQPHMHTQPPTQQCCVLKLNGRHASFAIFIYNKFLYYKKKLFRNFVYYYKFYL